VEFDVVVPEVEELEAGQPEDVALQNARRKALAVERPWVLGVDTVVALGKRIYGKPADIEQARGTLAALSGQVHTVISGVCLVERGQARTATARTDVRVRALSDALIEWYLASGEWRERAGGYAIQGRGAALVAAIDGDYSNVVGLPVATLLDLLPGLLGD